MHKQEINNRSMHLKGRPKKINNDSSTVLQQMLLGAKQDMVCFFGFLRIQVRVWVKDQDESQRLGFRGQG